MATSRSEAKYVAPGLAGLLRSLRISLVLAFWPRQAVQPGGGLDQQVQGGAQIGVGIDDWTPTGFVDTIRSGTMVYEERTGRGTGSQEVHPGI
jgi:hypothetical protein